MPPLAASLLMNISSPHGWSYVTGLLPESVSLKIQIDLAVSSAAALKFFQFMQNENQIFGTITTVMT